MHHNLFAQIFKLLKSSKWTKKEADLADEGLGQ